MGHDITAYHNDEEIAYLRRGAFNSLNVIIYDALNADEYYMGCSGDGSTVKFTREQISDAVKKIIECKFSPEVIERTEIDNKNMLGLISNEIEFLNKCLQFEEVNINFG